MLNEAKFSRPKPRPRVSLASRLYISGLRTFGEKLLSPSFLTSY